MSDLVGNPEDRFSRVAAHMGEWLPTGRIKKLVIERTGMGSNSTSTSLFFCANNITPDSTRVGI